ncbi:MAG: hypothetical protein U9P14_04710 [Gemmatimonadota bacterium]|nr:hypothetical protein [Gemmatimonadota bacterium]
MARRFFSLGGLLTERPHIRKPGTSMLVDYYSLPFGERQRHYYSSIIKPKPVPQANSRISITSFHSLREPGRTPGQGRTPFGLELAYFTSIDRMA